MPNLTLIFVTSLLFAATWSLAGCGNSTFSGGSTSKKEPNTIDQSAAAGAGGGAGADRDGGDAGFSPGELVYQELTGTDRAGEPVDVVVAFDTSMSMAEESKYLSDNMKPFLTKLVNNNVDAQGTVIAKVVDYSYPQNPNAPATTFPKVELKFPTDLPKERFALYEAEVDSHNAIGVLNTFFSTNANPLKQRPDVNLEIVIITDDNGEGLGNLAADFKTPQAKSVTINSIIGLQAGQDATNAACDIPNVGDEYKKLSDQTKGVVFDLCRTDWDKLLSELSDSIIERNSNGFSLKAAPDLAKEFKVTLNGVVLPSTEYEIDSAALIIRFKTDLTSKDTVTLEYYAKG